MKRLRQQRRGRYLVIWRGDFELRIPLALWRSWSRTQRAAWFRSQMALMGQPVQPRDVARFAGRPKPPADQEAPSDGNPS